MAKSVKKNYIYSLSYELMMVITPLIVTPYVSRVLRSEGVGAYSYAASMVSYFVLFATLGTAIYGNREIAALQDNIEKRSLRFWSIFVTRLILSVIALVGYSVYYWVSTRNSVLILVFSSSIINVVVDVSWFFQGLEEFKKIVLRNAVVKVINIFLIFTLVNNKNDVWVYTAIMCGSTLLSSILLWPFLPKYLCKVRGVRPFHDLKGILQLFIPTLAIQLYTVLDKSMIGWMTIGTVENGLYEQADKIIKTGLVVITTFGTVLMPRISYMYSKGDTDSIQTYISKSFHFIYFLAVPLCLGMCSIAGRFVPIYFGTGWDKVVVLISMFSFLFIIIGTSNIIGRQFLVPTYRQNILTISVCIGAAVNFALNLILIPKYASIGACIASVVAECCVTIVQIFYVQYRKLLQIKQILLSLWKYWVAGFVMSGVIVVIKIFIPNTVIGLVVVMFFAMAVYFLMLLLLQDLLLQEILKAIFMRITNNRN